MELARPANTLATSVASVSIVFPCFLSPTFMLLITRTCTACVSLLRFDVNGSYPLLTVVSSISIRQVWPQLSHGVFIHQIVDSRGGRFCLQPTRSFIQLIGALLSNSTASPNGSNKTLQKASVQCAGKVYDPLPPTLILSLYITCNSSI